MRVYLETRFIGTLLLRTRAYASAWQMLQGRFEPPFLIFPFQALRIEHMLLHQADKPLKVAALRGYQEWQHHLQEGIFQLASLDWDAAGRLAMDLNRSSMEHRISPMHYLEAAACSLAEAEFFVSLERYARSAASLAGLRLVPENLTGH